MIPVKFFDKSTEEASPSRRVSKAFLITGGTEETRQEKYRELYQGDQFLMCCSYKGEDELAVIFSSKHEDFKNMAFEEAKALAGSTSLDPTFRTSTFGKEPQFGIINMTSAAPKPTFGKLWFWVLSKIEKPSYTIIMPPLFQTIKFGSVENRKAELYYKPKNWT